MERLVRENASESYPAASKQCPLSGISFSALIRHFPHSSLHLFREWDKPGRGWCSQTRSAVSRSPRMNAVPPAVSCFFTSTRPISISLFMPFFLFQPMYGPQPHSEAPAIFQSLAALDYPGQRASQCSIVVPPCLPNASMSPSWSFCPGGFPGFFFWSTEAPVIYTYHTNWETVLDHDALGET